MKNVIVGAASLLFAVPAFAGPTTWEIDSSHSSAQFSVRHLMVSNVKGEFSKVSGNATLDGNDPAKAAIEATIDASTINTREAKRDEHLKSPDFFDVAKFPTITFKSKKAVKAGKGKLKVTGDLTLHGVTKEVVLEVEGPTAEIKDPWGNVRVGASASTKINRKDFGLSWNKALESGGVVVGEEIPVTIDVELIKKQEAAPAEATAKGTK